MSFDPKKHTIRVQGGREYLPVSARLVWFRQDHPDWGIVTESVEIDLEKKYAIFKTTIFNEDGRIMATATKMEDIKGFADFVEKAETGSVGRALAFCGYGTQFAPELEIQRTEFAPQNRGMERNPQMPGSDTGQGMGNPGNAPGQGRYGNPNPNPNMNRPPLGTGGNPSPNPMPGNAMPPPPQSRPAQRPATNENPNITYQMKPPPNTGAPITRVKERLPDVNMDPGGDDDVDEDEFLEDGFDETPPTNPTRPPLAPSVSGGDIPVITNIRCEVEGCPAVLTQSQITVSTNKFGRPLCPIHQRDATPLTLSSNGNGAQGANNQNSQPPNPPRRSNPL